jgi:uncharacterized protein (TIGR03067 family)
MRKLVLFAVTTLTLTAATANGQGDADELARDRQRFQGTWGVATYDQDGSALPADLVAKMSVTIQGDRLTIRPRVVAQRIPTLKDGKTQATVKFVAEEGKADEAKYRLDVAKKRKVIELTQDVGGGQSRKMTGIYELEENSLTICIPLPDRKLPKKMPASPASGMVRLVLKKAAAPKPGAP